MIRVEACCATQLRFLARSVSVPWRDRSSGTIVPPLPYYPEKIVLITVEDAIEGASLWRIGEQIVSFCCIDVTHNYLFWRTNLQIDKVHARMASIEIEFGRGILINLYRD